VVDHRSQPLKDALALVAPGTPLRQGLDRVLQANLGALVVVGDNPAVLSLCTGGFLLDAEFSPQRLSELAKMDGAVILARDGSRIARANVHLVPKASVPTSETGTRHRTAERVARSIDVPVITVSEAMSTIAVYRNEHKHTLEPTGQLVDRASQALRTLQRFRTRFNSALFTLSGLEVEDTVSLRDVVEVLQPGEMALRISDEIEDYLIELGADGRMYRLQLEELAGGLDDELALIVRDYVGRDAPASRRAAAGDDGQRKVTASTAALRALTNDDLLDPVQVAGTLALRSLPEGLDTGVTARGYRLLHRLPRVSDTVIDRIVRSFGGLPAIMQASLTDLEKVGGVGAVKARAVRDGLSRMVEASILERYD
jgi:diadenylate cyclase